MASWPRPLLVDVEVVMNDWVKVGVAAMALVERKTPPSPATLMPFCQTIRVLPVRSLGSKTMLLTLRFPVHGMSKQPAEVVEMPILVAPTPAGAPVTLVSRYSPLNPSGGTEPPNGASPPLPMTPPAVPTNSVVGSLGIIRMLEMERPVKTAALTGTLEALM